MIDCSHANSKTVPSLPRVIGQIATGDRRIMGVMLESNLVPAAQKLLNGKPLVYGQSIPDACIGWDEILDLLRELAASVRYPRGHGGEKGTIAI